MMDKTGYERYGLSGNPFRDLSSENLEDVALYHVAQSIDEDLNGIRDEALEKENQAVIALMGGLGAGKTERLLLLKKEAQAREAFCVVGGVTTETQFMMRGILEEMIKNAKTGGKRSFGSPKWVRKLQKINKRILKEYDPEAAGQAIADALNDNAPAFLLINDLHRLPEKEDMESFLQTLYVITNEIQPGVLVVLSADEKYFKGIMKDHPTLNERINRKIIIPPLNAQEASLMLAKRLLAKRLVDEMDALYPFTPEAVAALNGAAGGNPRMLLRFADYLLDSGVKARIVQIDEDFIKATMEQKDALDMKSEFESDVFTAKEPAPVDNE